MVHSCACDMEEEEKGSLLLYTMDKELRKKKKEGKRKLRGLYLSHRGGKRRKGGKKRADIRLLCPSSAGEREMKGKGRGFR